MRRFLRLFRRLASLVIGLALMLSAAGPLRRWVGLEPPRSSGDPQSPAPAADTRPIASTEPDGPPPRIAESPSTEGDESALEVEIFQGTNDARLREGLESLKWSSRLEAAARHHAANMASLEEMAHELPETDTPTLRTRLTFVGLAPRLAGENVAMGQRSAEAVVQAWLDSPGHRANIMKAEFTELGVGVARSEAGVPYYCQVFARP